jgi:hypothetical protein
MTPVEVTHVCDICGARQNGKADPMVYLSYSVDGRPVWQHDLVCEDCRAQLLHAIHQVEHERKANASTQDG